MSSHIYHTSPFSPVCILICNDSLSDFLHFCTWIWFLTCVCFDRLLESENFPTHIKLEWFLSYMCSRMSCQKTRHWKSLPTYITLEWFLPCMWSHMDSQGAGVCECLPTYITLEWFLPCVWSHMHSQGARVCECLFTYITLEWFRSCVWSHMHALPDDQTVRMC